VIGALWHRRLWKKVVSLVSSYHQVFVLAAFHNAMHEVKGLFIPIVLCQRRRLEIGSKGIINLTKQFCCRFSNLGEVLQKLIVLMGYFIILGQCLNTQPCAVP
jgi:hypothetical protein